jgi:hypothetical protein
LTDTTERAVYVWNQKKLCEISGVDFKKVEELNSIITPLLNNLTKANLKIVNEKFADITRKLDYWMDVVGVSASKEANLTPEQKSLLELLSYLVLVEGIFSEIVQVIAFILVENHHDIYDEENREFVRNYEGLNNLSLFKKMQFVEIHGFEFVSHACDRDLRNSIAHLRIIVKDDGSMIEITRKGKTGKAIKDMSRKTDYLSCVCAMTVKALHGILGKLLGVENARTT